MSRKSVIPREVARRDVESAIDYYIREAGAETALAFIDALEKLFDSIADNPTAGSPRYSLELALPGLRSRILNSYHYLVFYREDDDRIDIWRILHAKRDIPALMREEDR